ncbi:MAG: MFS transporter [Actinobacteria bacterium]|nr:MFS transporter [Actinomycetota bacterium]MBO0785506.1 MFS transporter [Actinomycetota bacterium]
MVVATALTAIRRHLGASLADLEWTVSAYTLSFAVLLMTAAAVGDRLGRRRVFAAGLAVFAAASAGCALAPDAGALIAARAVQGAGAAAIMPMALALLNGAFPPARRGWAIGIYGGVTALAAVAGPVLGGAVTQGLGWEWIFWLNVPVALAAIPLLLARVREATGTAGRSAGAGREVGRGRLAGESQPGKHRALDLPGLVLVTVAALGLVWGLIRGNAAGWGSAEVVGALAGGAVAAAGFAAWERRAARPMLPPRLFRSPAFTSGNIAIFVINASLTGVIFLMPQYQQVVAGQDPLGAGLRLLPWGIAPLLIGPRAGALADRIGERTLVVTGSLLQAAGAAWLAAAAGPGSGYLVLITPMIMIGAGLGLAIPALTRAVTSTVPPADIGTASGAFSTARQLGGAFGVAVLGAAFAATGSYATPGAFSHGFVTAFGVAAGLAVAGTAAGTILPGRGAPSSPVAPAAAGGAPGAGRAPAVSRPAPSSAHLR